jgi:peptide deformylase
VVFSTGRRFRATDYATRAPHYVARMAVLKIVRMGHPVLLARAAPVALPADAETRRLARDMVETMEDASGAGLAAPQVAVGLRLIVFKVAPERASGAPGDQPMAVRVLANPEIEPIPGEPVLAFEGCLSIPGLRGAVPRHARIRYRGFDLDGHPIEAEAEGFHARVVQHEVDHLDGILYPMRMADFRLFGFTEELARAHAPAAEKEGA